MFLLVLKCLPTTNHANPALYELREGDTQDAEHLPVLAASSTSPGLQWPSAGRMLGSRLERTPGELGPASRGLATILEQEPEAGNELWLWVHLKEAASGAWSMSTALALLAVGICLFGDAGGRDEDCLDI